MRVLTAGTLEGTRVLQKLSIVSIVSTDEGKKCVYFFTTAALLHESLNSSLSPILGHLPFAVSLSKSYMYKLSRLTKPNERKKTAS